MWKEEAGLGTKATMGSLFIQTFASSLRNDVGLIVKQLFSEWPGMTVKRFTMKILEKNAAGCFDFKEVAKMHYQESLQHCNPLDARHG